MKLPRLPHKCNIFDAKYSAEQMHEYAHRAIRDYLNESYKQPIAMEPMKTPAYKSIVEKIKEAW
jgi:hypothetical protein